MDYARILRHLCMSRGQVDRAFPAATLLAIEGAIKTTEAAHCAEVRFVVEGALECMPLYRGQTSRERAVDVFSNLRMWDTEHNSGVLLYLLLADRQVEIVADRGIHQKVGPGTWTEICHEMETAFKAGNFDHGAVHGVQAVAQHLVEHFPATVVRSNELSDEAVVL
ncbi:MAG: TPM domain-containing protein [Burkholderiaceae bacterium]